MNRIVTLKGVPILALSIVLAACGQASADQPSADPLPSTPPVAQPSEQPSQAPAEPVATPKPSQQADEDPTEQPSQAPAEPVATPKPIVVIEHGVPIIARVTSDGVAVRNLPDLESAIVDGNDPGDEIVEQIRLRRGDEVVVFVGPVYADGYSWYEVMAGGTGPAEYFRGWVAGEFLEHVSDADVLGPVLWVDGQGFTASAFGHVAAYSPLVVQHGVTPMPGQSSCAFGMSLVNTRGERIEIVPERTVTGAMVGQAAAGNLDALYMASEGTVTLDVTGDCSFAAAVRVLNG
jgi:hypothetical protein